MTAKRNNLKIVNIGNLIDFLEFSLFSSLMPLMAKEFFGDTGSPEAASLFYLLFFIGFIGRPFGAMIFGAMGDHFGRRQTLVISILGMSISTFLLSIIPVCFLSMYLVGLVRFMQGIFTGGEYANAAVHVIEEKSKDKGFSNAANLTASGIFGVSIGQILGTIIAGGWIPFMNWRYAFVLVSVISLIVSLNRAFRASEPFQKNDRNKINAKGNYKLIIQGIMFGGMLNGIFYLLYTFIGTFNSLNGDKIVMNSYYLSIISSFLFGGSLILSSKIQIIKSSNPTQVLKYSLIGMFIFIYPMYAQLSAGNLTLISFIFLISFVFCMQTATLIIMSCYPKQFSRNSRVLFSGLSISIGNSVLGGSSPYISSKIIFLTGNNIYPVIYFMGLILCSFFVTSLWPLKNEDLSHELLFSKK